MGNNHVLILVGNRNPGTASAWQQAVPDAWALTILPGVALERG